MYRDLYDTSCEFTETMDGSKAAGEPEAEQGRTPAPGDASSSAGGATTTYRIVRTIDKVRAALDRFQRGNHHHQHSGAAPPSSSYKYKKHLGHAVGGEAEEDSGTTEGDWEMVPPPPRAAAEMKSGETGRSKKDAVDARATTVVVDAGDGEPKAESAPSEEEEEEEPAPGEKKEGSEAEDEWELVGRAVPWRWGLSPDPRTGELRIQGQCRCLRCDPRPRLEIKYEDPYKWVYDYCLFDPPRTV